MHQFFDFSFLYNLFIVSEYQGFLLAAITFKGYSTASVTAVFGRPCATSKGSN